MFCFDHDLKIDIDLLFDFDSHSKMKSYENYDVMALFASLNPKPSTLNLEPYTLPKP